MKKLIRVALLSIFTMTSVAVFAEAATSNEFSPAQVKQLDGIIHDYIVNNPQVLVEASQTLQAQQEKKMESAAMSAIQQNKTTLFDDTKTPSIGNKDASTTLVEFFDYQCGHCREMAPQIEKLVSEDKNLRVVFKELPIFGGMSNYAAKVALAVQMQSPEKYYEFHNALFALNSGFTKQTILSVAKKLGLNMETLKTDMNSPALENQLKSNFELAQSLKIMGTPTFVIGNKAQTKFAYIPGATSLENMKKEIQSVQ